MFFVKSLNLGLGLFDFVCQILHLIIGSLVIGGNSFLPLSCFSSLIDLLSSAMISSAFGPRVFLNLSVSDLSRPESFFLKMSDSPPFGPNKTILASSPFLLNLIWPSLAKLTFENLLVIISLALSRIAGLSSLWIEPPTRGVFSSKQVSAARSVIQDECALQFVRLHDKVWMQSPFERVGAVNWLLVIVIVVEVPVKVGVQNHPLPFFIYIMDDRVAIQKIFDQRPKKNPRRMKA